MEKRNSKARIRRQSRQKQNILINQKMITIYMKVQFSQYDIEKHLRAIKESQEYPQFISCPQKIEKYLEEQSYKWFYQSQKNKYFCCSQVKGDPLLQQLICKLCKDCQGISIWNSQLSIDFFQTLALKQNSNHAYFFSLCYIGNAFAPCLQKIAWERISQLVLKHDPFSNKGLKYLSKLALPSVFNFQLAATNITTDSINLLKKLQLNKLDLMGIYGRPKFNTAEYLKQVYIFQPSCCKITYILFAYNNQEETIYLPQLSKSNIRDKDHLKIIINSHNRDIHRQMNKSLLLSASTIRALQKTIQLVRK